MQSDLPQSISPTAPRDAADAIGIAASCVRRRLKISAGEEPVIGVILGSGLGAAAGHLLASGGRSISYDDIPGMPSPLISGHPGRFVYGRISGLPVAMLQGRVHFYEGHSNAAVAFGTRLLHALHVKTTVITNAAGGIRTGFQPGDLMLIKDHLRPVASYVELHQPLKDIGFSLNRHALKNRTRTGGSLLLWHEGLRRQLRQIVTPLKVHEGVYAMMPGPNYETPAEIRMLRGLGADAVGMSTVPEALVAASLGMRVLGVSCITNIAAGLSAASLSHTEVTETAAAIERQFGDWLEHAIRILGADSNAVA